MKRGPKAEQTLAEAAEIAHERGIVHVVKPGRETLYDLSIAPDPIAFIRACFTERIRATITDIARDFHEEILGLRLVTRDAAHSCELWLRSRYGTWRFFRVTADAIIEIGRNGLPLGEKEWCVSD